MAAAELIFKKTRLGGISLKNRVIKAACFEGMTQGGRPTKQLTDHHAGIAEGGVAMTTLAYCSVSAEGRAYDHELWMRPEIAPELRQFTSVVHQKGALVSIQLGHCGYFASKKVIGERPLGASAKFNLFRMSFCKRMSNEDIQRIVDDFTRAADLARSCGFDAIEIHAGHGYLLNQFLSPYTNKRRDQYGGSLTNRMRFPLEVIKALRKLLGPDYPILVKMNLRDGIRNGLQLEDAIEIARAFEKGGASALVPSSGFTSKTPFRMLRGKLPVKEMVANQKNFFTRVGLALFGRFIVKMYPYHPLFHLKEALSIKKAVNIPVIYLGGIHTADHIKTALISGFDFVQSGRALIHDAEFMNRIKAAEPASQTCDHCNRCIAAMDGGGVYCVSKVRGYIP